ncbi:hypothetical protein BGX24_011794 [Mortierella sp. AD032]|nr:hypothetical protein BGX24_011794 [Mortierella sp. AD032]
MHNNHPTDNKLDFYSNNTASNIKNCRRLQQQVSALPRPKTILLASLWAWTLLMTLSAKMGFNSLEQTSVSPSFAVSSPPTRVPTNAIVGGSSAASSSPIFILPPVLPFPADLQSLETEEDDGEIDLRLWEPTSDLWSTEQQQQGESMSSEDEMVALLDMDIDVQFDAIEEDEEAQPFARIQTNIVIINNNDNNNADTEPSFILAEDEDIEDMSSLDAMIMDSQDEAAFHDFLHKLDQEDQALEQAQDQQRRKLLKATDDLMVSSMLDNDLPCGYYNRDGLFSDNKWLAGIQQLLVGDSTSAVDAGHFPGRTFVYTGWSTDLMIVAVAMCLGGVLVGLAQSKILYHQLLDQHIAASSFATASTNPLQRRGVSWTTLLASFSLSTSALALTFLMIADESWDVPAIYFVGIGISGIILVHAYVPNAALTIHNYQRDTTDVSSSDSDDDDENTCIGSDNEYEDDSKVLSPVETSFVWSPPMAERRNACSLDENRRWEVVAAATTLHETNCYTR